MVPVIAIVGRSGVGKTVIMEKLIAEFKSRGYRVGAVKHTHQTIDLDAPGKDTWRYTEAGSDAVAISSPLRVTVFNKLDHEPALEETVRLLVIATTSSWQRDLKIPERPGSRSAPQANQGIWYATNPTSVQ